MGVCEVASRFLFRDGTTSSISVDCGESRDLAEGLMLLPAYLDKEDRVDRVLDDVALIIFEVS